MSIILFINQIIKIIFAPIKSYRLTAPKEPLAKSITPAVGLVTSPTTPFPNPLKNPSTPSSFAPDKGFITTPVTPSTTPYQVR